MHADKIKVLQEIARLSKKVPEISLHEEFILKALMQLAERMTPVYQGRPLNCANPEANDAWIELEEVQYANAITNPDIWETRILWTK